MHERSCAQVQEAQFITWSLGDLLLDHRQVGGKP